MAASDNETTANSRGEVGKRLGSPVSSPRPSKRYGPRVAGCKIGGALVHIDIAINLLVALVAALSPLAIGESAVGAVSPLIALAAMAAAEDAEVRGLALIIAAGALAGMYFVFGDDGLLWPLLIGGAAGLVLGTADWEN